MVAGDRRVCGDYYRNPRTIKSYENRVGHKISYLSNLFVLGPGKERCFLCCRVTVQGIFAHVIRPCINKRVITPSAVFYSFIILCSHLGVLNSTETK